MLSSSIGAAIGSFLIGVLCMFTTAGRAAFVAGKAGQTAEQVAAAEGSAARGSGASPREMQGGAR